MFGIPNQWFFTDCKTCVLPAGGAVVAEQTGNIDYAPGSNVPGCFPRAVIQHIYPTWEMLLMLLLSLMESVGRRHLLSNLRFELVLPPILTWAMLREGSTLICCDWTHKHTHTIIFCQAPVSITVLQLRLGLTHFLLHAGEAYYSDDREHFPLFTLHTPPSSVPCAALHHFHQRRACINIHSFSSSAASLILCICFITDWFNIDTFGEGLFFYLCEGSHWPMHCPAPYPDLKHQN